MSKPSSGSARKSSAFVPHDLAKPIKGSSGGPLGGLTVAVKDMFDLAGERTGGGNPEWLASRTRSKANAAAVSLLLDAGATVVGKTVCDEFFYSITGINAHYGMPKNPRAPHRIPGGSSSGSAVAVACGACDIGLGSDTGGSVRVPAAFNGVYGIRPTLGRVNPAGAMAMAPSFDAVGWFAAGPGLLAEVGGVLLDGQRISAPIERVRLAVEALAVADASIQSASTGFLQKISGVLPTASELSIAPEGFDGWRACFRTIQAFEIWGEYGAWIAEHKPRLGPGIRDRFDYASTVTRAEADAAREVKAALLEHVRSLVPPGTVLVLPTTPCIAPLANAGAEELDAIRNRIMALTCIAGLSGLPQVTLPIGTVDGCPIGLSFIGWPGADEALLELAKTLGAYCGD